MKELKVKIGDKIELFNGMIGEISSINELTSSVIVNEFLVYLDDIKIINHLPASGFKLKL